MYMGTNIIFIDSMQFINTGLSKLVDNVEIYG